MPFEEYNDYKPTDMKVYLRKLGEDEPIIFGEVVNAPELDLMSAIMLADEINRNGYPSVDGTFTIEINDSKKYRYGLFKLLGGYSLPKKLRLKLLKNLGLEKRTKLTYKTIKKR